MNKKIIAELKRLAALLPNEVYLAKENGYSGKDVEVHLTEEQKHSDKHLEQHFSLTKEFRVNHLRRMKRAFADNGWHSVKQYMDNSFKRKEDFIKQKMIVNESE